VVFENCACRSIVAGSSDAVVFAPQQVRHLLLQTGIQVRMAEEGRSEEPAQVDQRLELVERVLRAFMRSTGVNSDTFRQRLGTQSPAFFDQLLPTLKEHRIMVEVQYRGSGRQRRFELGVPFARVSEALEGCEGDFDRFLQLAGTA